ncbi:beta-galactosidase [Geobacillus sp. PK12]|uniref:Beta-galactosidase n=1 Tax=Geobacillus thermodenitrificans TaxID=33940 RepID=A0A291I5N3_GEOTD|nr:beta-galactosidase [Geobacillus sp. PK12]ATG84595.1 BgaA [Geobacillus thermodenitrificans]QFR52950.1 beta-galactosidase [Geobacillus sp.]RXS90457.1 beta-galactosidase [Geobacillus sp. PK12]
MNTLSRLPNMLYGGDYYPEQWDKNDWEKDIELLKKANINFVRLNIFSWALNQKDEITYNFEWLDEVIELLDRHGIWFGLGTGTAAHPAWMAKKYPDILRVEFDGKKRKFGGRHNSCPNSPTYRRFAKQLVRKLAQRYKNHPSLILWNISNEFGGACYCENCEKAFRVWLRRKYKTLDHLNRAWNTMFWGHLFYDWDEIVAPNLLSEHFGENQTMFQGISLDYARFNSDSMLECYLLEYEEIKKEMPETIVTTNIMGAYKPLDYFKWAKHMDVIGWDNYPSIDTPVSYTAMMHDLMRGLKDGQPFLLMEQTPSQQNWQPYNSLKRPGVMRLWSYQAVARGSDSVLFFQMKRSRGACEKFHGAVIDHVGHDRTRVFKEVMELGTELKQMGNTLLGATVPSKVAIVFDWENWWAVEYSSGPSIALKYIDEVHKYYRALFKQNIQADFIHTETDLKQYEVVIAPVLYMLKKGYAQKIEEFVRNGGVFITTFLSGIVDENDLVVLGGYPGELRPILGIWSEEIDALPPERKNTIEMKKEIGLSQKTYSCNLLFDLIHSEGAEVIAEYGEDFYKGMPAVTRNKFYHGEAWYIATSPEDQFLEELLMFICAEKGIQPLIEKVEGVEVSKRVKNGYAYLFLLNHNAHEVVVPIGKMEARDIITGRTVAEQINLPRYGVAILEYSET